MQRLQAYQFQIEPNGEQRRDLRRFAGACRFVYNKALVWQKQTYEQDSKTRFSYPKQANFLPQWKEEFPWLKEAPSQALQQTLKDLERAYQNFMQDSSSRIETGSAPRTARCMTVTWEAYVFRRRRCHRVDCAVRHNEQAAVLYLTAQHTPTDVQFKCVH